MPSDDVQPSLKSESIELSVQSNHPNLKLLYISITFLIVSILIGVFSIVHQQQDIWDPIGALPEQHVLNRQLEPYAVNDIIRVRGTKCFKELPVLIQGENLWTSVDPGGIQEESVIGGRVYDPKHPVDGDNWVGKCVTREFSNPVPKRVAEWAGQGVTEWKITGTMVPLKDDGKGLERRWFTESVKIKG